MGFLVVEDETSRLARGAAAAAELHRVIRGNWVIAVAGRVQRVQWHRSLALR